MRSSISVSCEFVRSTGGHNNKQLLGVDTYLPVLHVQEVSSFGHFVVTENDTSKHDGKILRVHLVFVAECNNAREVLK